METKTLAVKQSILGANMDRASQNREMLNRFGIHMINIMSSPGSGKTSLITRTIEQLSQKYRLAVIEGDIASSIDTDKISLLNIPAIQINTSGGCHLDSFMVEKALADFDLDNIDLVFIENVGNLVCTADFDLGAHQNVVILSIPEGDDKPYKYPLIFTEADVVLVNKIDVAPYFDFDLETFPGLINRINPKAKVLPISAKTGDGLQNWIFWIEQTLTDLI